jgi:extracellular elastinolytic metalloproteinase
MKSTFTRLLLLSALSLLTGLPVWTQVQTKLDIALRYVEQNREQWDLNRIDVVDMVVSDQYQSGHNGLTHVYFIQRYAGIEVHNAVLGVHIKENGKVVYAASRFIPDVEEKINAVDPILSTGEAVYKAAAHLGLTHGEPLRLISKVSDREFHFEGGEISHHDIKVKLMFQPLRKSGRIRLAWDLSIDQIGSPDWWSMRVDALTGEILEQNNWTVYCSFHPEDGHVHDGGCDPDGSEMAFTPVKEALLKQNEKTLNNGAMYHVFPFSAESPIHGQREMLTDPHDPVASPHGWHDTNNQAGAEYTITRGNNVHAYLDIANTNASAGDEPDGGPELVFDFPFNDQNSEPDEYGEAAVTQLFYMNNIMHDFTYRYGFNEVAGNFQQNIYGNGGAGGDFVRAEAQDGSGNNNANFATPPDGQSGRMQMFLWSAGGGRILTVNAPEGLAGQQFEARPASFGGPVTTTPVTGEVAIVDDGSNSPTLGCNPPVNAAEVAGRVALIDRGICEFGLKSLNAQQAGAIAVIICNFENALVSMGAGAVGGQVTIPVVSMTSTDCQVLRQIVNQGLVVTIQLPESSGPTFLDADFDNGIIAHEYGHGISNRLTGGPSQAGCLNNDEQMGEGWSDFFSLITSARPGDNGAMARGIGTYVLREGLNGRGIRNRPYTTDMNINEHTYSRILGTTSPHALGEVWATMLWDLYWRFVDEYGWDEDLYSGTGGNNIAIQLVMDGMKIQACNPGFIEGRNAIIAADYANYDGIHECLIWEVFARRGLGWYADGGTAFDRNDGAEDFEPMPECIKELKIKKTVTGLVNAGEEITVNITVTNHKGETVSEVTVNDELPEGLSYVGGSITGGLTATVSGDVLTIEIGQMTDGQTKTFSYRLGSDPELKSVRQFFDGAEEGDGNWELEAPEGIDIWDITDELAYSGQYSWFVPDMEAENDQILRLREPFTVTGTQPVLRFYHQYNTESGYDGGFVQITKDGGANWDNVSTLMFRNSYPRPLAYGTFAIPNLQAFSGNSNGWVDTYVDLQPYLDEEILVRFRFGSDIEVGGIGWYVDNIEFMDMFNYDTEACVSSNEGDLACAQAPGRGTVVESATLVSTDDPLSIPFDVAVYPNPADDLIQVAVSGDRPAERVVIEMMTVDGRVLTRRIERMAGMQQVFAVNVSELAGGFYLVRVSTEKEAVVKKVVIE